MAKKYLDDNGLLYFWQKIKSMFVTDVNYDSTNKKITKTKNGSTSDVVTLATMKTDMALNNVANGAEVNQNAFSNVKVGSTTIAADSKTDTLELVAGANVTLTPDATNDKLTIAATNTTYTPASADPLMDGTAAVGTSVKYAREDHVHPTDTSRASNTAFNTFKNNVVMSSIDGAKLSNISNENSTIIHYAACSTSAGTTAKTVALAGGFNLITGSRIAIKFTVTNTASVSNLTLNVQESGAKPIRYRGAVLPSAGTLAANRVYEFVYDGTNWELVGDLDTNSTYTPASANPLMDGTVAVGTSAKYAREDHRHPSDTSKVSESVFNTAGYTDASDFITKTEAAFSQCITISQKGAASGVCPLNASSKIDSTYLPSYVDDVIEAYARSGQTALSQNWLATGSASGTVITPETGKIYVLMADSGDYAANTQFRWSGTTYVKLNDGGVTSITNAEIDTIVAA